MKSICLMSAAAVIAAATANAATFSLDEDFTLKDERGLSPAIEIEKHSSLSHLHGEIVDREEGGYRLLVPGNRHYFAMPPVGDFKLTLDYELHLYYNEFGLGYDVFFGADHVFRVYFPQKGNFEFLLDGKKFAEGDRAIEKGVQEYPGTLEMEMKGTMLTVSVYGKTASVRVESGALGDRALPAGAGALGDRALPTAGAGALGDRALPAGADQTVGADHRAARPRGKIGFDMPYSGGNQLTLRHAVLTSDDAPAKTPVTDYKFVLKRCQGFSEHPVYLVKLGRYATGETELQLVLRGLLGDATNRIETGGGEWGSLANWLDTPYLRVERKDGSEFANLPLWNGVRILKDPELKRRMMRDQPGSGEAMMKMEPWPIERTFVFSHFPEDWTLAAGYLVGMQNRNKAMGNGPYEQIRDKAGKFVYEGASVRRGHVAVAVKPTPDPKFLARIPKDLPRYDEAIRHASEQGYFLESTVPSFSVKVTVNPHEYAPSEVSYTTETTTLYGDSVKSDAKLPVGVYKYVVHWKAGLKTGSEKFIFEVLSDDPDGICPPLASKLPFLYTETGEVKFFEDNVFNPWAEFGGAQHYYATSAFYPAVGLTNRVWDALKPYCRKWYALNWNRNTDDVEPWSKQNKFINKVAGFTYSGETDRFDFTHPASYRQPYQMKILADYYAEKNPPAKLLTPAHLAELVKKPRALTDAEFLELFTTCWEDFGDWARVKADALDRDFEERLLKHNPKIGRAGYGPMPIYGANYKTPYFLRTSSKGLDTHPGIKANDSFWVFEEYHFSCDYPLCRGSLFVSAYTMLYPNGRKIFPEVYYSGWGRCNDGAVFQAHPGKRCILASTHQRRLAYDYAYGTAHFRDGKYGYWKESGFHAGCPDPEDIEAFVMAWGDVVRNPPRRAPKAAFAMVDFGAFRRRGDYLETDCNFQIVDGPIKYLNVGDVNNTAEESIAYLYEKVALNGRVTPVVSDLSELDAITPELCTFVILPPIVAGTPPETLEAIRRLHARGVNLLASEAVVGLEDLFGVKESAPRKLTALGAEKFSHKLAVAHYAPHGAQVLIAGNDAIPVIMLNETKTGRTGFINVPPTVVNRATMRGRYCRGQPAVSDALEAAVLKTVAFLEPEPEIESEHGEICATYTDGDKLVVTIGDPCPIYHDGNQYPLPFRFTVRGKGIGRAKIETAAPYSIVERTADKLVLRTETARDDALFFTFSLSAPSGPRESP